MAKRQYRVCSTGNWATGYGNAFLALFNQSGSGRKLTIRQLCAYVQSVTGGATPWCWGEVFQSATPFTGEDMVAYATKLDSTATLPSTVVVRRNGTISAYATKFRKHSLVRRGGAYGTQEDFRACNRNRSGGRHLFGGAYNRGATRGNTTVEPLTVPQNTGLAMVVSSEILYTSPTRVNLVVSVDGKTITWDFVAVLFPGQTLWSLENTGTEVVQLLSYSFAEVGTSDTPFLRVVPIGQLYSSTLLDSSVQSFQIEKMDSAYPDLTALKVFGDVGFIPSGSPQVVVSAGSASTPKGVNYLHTRDFDGPCYRVFLPEMRSSSGGGATAGTVDMWGMHANPRWADLLLRKKASSPLESIVLNPGEGIAIVGSAETLATGGAYSGWPSLDFQVIIDSEPQISPTLTLTGLKNPTEVRIFEAGTTTLLAGQEDVTSGTYSWNYDPDLVSSVDISILALGYQNTRLLAIATTGNVNIPIQQQLDRQYFNP